MATEIVRYPTNYQVIQRATENSLDEAKNSRTIEVPMANIKMNKLN